MLLLDEPLSNLDAKLRVRVREDIREIQQRPRDHHGVRHPRPGRGAVDLRPRRRDERRPDRAVCVAGGHLPVAGDDVRGWLRGGDQHRLRSAGARLRVAGRRRRIGARPRRDDQPARGRGVGRRRHRGGPARGRPRRRRRRRGVGGPRHPPRSLHRGGPRRGRRGGAGARYAPTSTPERWVPPATRRRSGSAGPWSTATGPCSERGPAVLRIPTRLPVKQLGCSTDTPVGWTGSRATGCGPGRTRPLAIAHRGDPIAHRENTTAAIRSALDCGADVVEIDVKTTEDGVSVVLHDDSLWRLVGASTATSGRCRRRRSSPSASRRCARCSPSSGRRPR